MELSRGKIIPQLASEHECTACLACENICPKQALDHYLDEDGHVYVKIDPLKCIGCLKCQQVCEKSRSYCGENNLSASKPYAAWAKNEEDRANATSGGVFAAFARTILEAGGCVIGAELNGFDCKHTVIYSGDDIHRLQGSKYMASSMEDVYTIISEELPHRDVLFSGVGCQCAGVLAFFEGFKTDYKLYTIDLVCGGAPSRILIDKFKEQYPDVKGFVSFRSKDKYELRVKIDSGEEIIKEKSLPLHGFNCSLTNRYSCYHCQFARAHRKTDCTIGDLWDYSILPDEHKKGLSMLLCHTDTGVKLLRKSDICFQPVEWKGVLPNNKRTVFGEQIVYFPRRRLEKATNKMRRDRFFKLYTITMKPRDVDLFAFRLYRFFREKLLSKKRSIEILAMIKSSKSQ